jgi:hypothetical protein
MSSNGQPSQSSNKKQRRKNARANLQTTRLPEDEDDQTQAKILTQNNHQRVNDISLAANGIDGLIINVKEQIDTV